MERRLRDKRRIFPTRITLQVPSRPRPILPPADILATSPLWMDHTRDDTMPSTADFVKKLYKMLEDKSVEDVVSWSPDGDSFIVKDMNEFTKTVLPKMFKHSNFASFVRQLNKYDFHKVKTGDSDQYGEQSWTFRHPDFSADKREGLENIKRKVPGARKQAQEQAQAQASPSVSASTPYHSHRPHHHHHSTGHPLSPSPSPSMSSSHLPYLPSTSHPSTGVPIPSNQFQVDALQAQVRLLQEQQDEMTVRMRALERNYQDILVQMVGLQRGMAQQDRLMQSLIEGWLTRDQQSAIALLNTAGFTNPHDLLSQLGQNNDLGR
ncbi:hypothetical protein BDN72DRAFT_881277 [Pluteus cervinus]|uniref:Uncharacterized protein n=1 Tax=Pluteus cervinus TaxID=181527 RepID=A0ACD3AH40_9AGAR|nr:hypothetical protein BDN72DRAFT_881277 [Pluteus cervinus]